MLITTIDENETQIPTFREHAAQSMQSIQSSLHSPKNQVDSIEKDNLLDRNLVDKNHMDRNFPYFSLTEEPSMDRRQDILMPSNLPQFGDLSGSLRNEHGEHVNEPEM